MTKTAQTDAAVTRFLEGWRMSSTPADGAPTVAFGEGYWSKMPADERALFDTFEDFGCAISVRVVAAS